MWDVLSCTLIRIPFVFFPRRRRHTRCLSDWSSDVCSSDLDAVEGAMLAGYRHVDCASVYGNERQIGAALARLFAQGIRREDLWITSKLWNDKHGEENVILSCRQSLADLGLQYLDLYLVHWPFPNFHPPGCGVEVRSAEAQPYIQIGRAS